MSEKSVEAKNVTGSTIVVGKVDGNVTNTFTQASGASENTIDMSQLSEQLSKLREAMSQEAKDTDHYIAMGKVAEAEKAAQEKDLSGVLGYLKSAGKWTLDVATRIGVSIAVEVIKQATGLK